MAPSYDTQPQAHIKQAPCSRVLALDFLRSMAIIFVLVTHFREKWLPGGSVGVSIFFCLSGFLITKKLLDERNGALDFWIRRTFRIYPAYIAACVLHLAILYCCGSGSLSNYRDSFFYLLFLVKMPDVWMGFGVGVLWSLQVELWFYFLAPFLIIKFSPDKRSHVTISLILISLSIKTIWLVRYTELPIYSVFSMLFWMDNILYGALAALVVHRNDKPTNELPYIIHLLFLALASIFAIAFLIPSVGAVWPLQSSFVAAITAVIILFSLQNKLRIKIPRAVSYVSLLSYTIYLAHPFALDYKYLIKQVVIYPGCAPVLSILMVPAIALSLHYLIEKPGIEIGKKISLLAKSRRPLTAGISTASQTTLTGM